MKLCKAISEHINKEIYNVEKMDETSIFCFLNTSDYTLYYNQYNNNDNK